MAFTGKATFSAGATLPENAEDVSDIIGIVSPFETPLLDHLGDAKRSASGTVHEWLEDELLPNTDTINDATIVSPLTEATFTVANGNRFRVGDQIQVEGSREIMFVADVTVNDLTVLRGYGNSTAENIADADVINILGNAALEGDDAPATRFTNRARQSNYTQIFTASLEVSGSQLAAQQIGLADELDYQKQERLRELIRDLENSVINGINAPANPQGSATVRRSMKGLIPFIQTNRVDGGSSALTEDLLNSTLRNIWSQSAGTIDTIVVNGAQKRKINGFITSSRSYDANDTRFRDLVGVYESDFGVCRVVLSRWVPGDSLLLLDSSRIDVLPLSGRSFHFNPLARTGDRESGQVVGEYTLELRNENAHGIIHRLAVA